MGEAFALHAMQKQLDPVHQTILTLILLNPELSFFENIVDPDKLASKEAIWSGSTEFSTLIE